MNRAPTTSVGRGGGRGDQWDVVFAHGVIERGEIFREDFAPFYQLDFEALIEVGEDGGFGGGGSSVGAVDQGLQMGEFAVEHRRIVGLVFAGLRFSRSCLYLVVDQFPATGLT